MAHDLESLKRQLQETEQEFEHAKAHMYRCDGVIQYLRRAMAEAEIPAPEAETPPTTS